MGRLKFVDWARGVAVIVMIVCHGFNAFAQPAIRGESLYRLSQFIGGMASVLFLFLAGMTLAFKMSSGDRKREPPVRRWTSALRRAGYVLFIAYLFRLSNWIGYFPDANWETMLKVDILNCMGVAMAALSLTAFFPGGKRAQIAFAAGCLIAALAPVAMQWQLADAPKVIRDYIVPQRAAFAFFPWSAYLAFGVSAGSALSRTPSERLASFAYWTAISGFGFVLGGRYFGNLPWSFYSKEDYWLSSPAMVMVKVGICLLLLAASYLWAEMILGERKSWVLLMGQHSLLLYWVHIAIVYGRLAEPWRQKLGPAATTIVTLLVIAAMAWLAEHPLRWPARKPGQPSGILRPAL